MNLETARQALTLVRNEDDFAWVSIIESTGSSPRHAGAHMLVQSDGTTVGTIGGGALEARAIDLARDVLQAGESRLAQYDLTNDDAAGLGMICGGAGLLLVDFVSHSDPAMTSLFGAIADLLDRGGRGTLVTMFPVEPSPGWRAQRCLVLEADRTVVGSQTCVALGGDALASSRRELVVAGERMRVQVEAMGGRGTVFVFGAGHCAQSLVPLLRAVAFRTVVVDDRAEYANRDRFPEADSLVVSPTFEGAVAGLPIDDDSYVVILTRGHLHDRTVLKEALQTEARYVGMIGSRRKVAQTMEALREEGIEAGLLDRVHAPIGLPIGAETPEEIAVSITAELIQVRAEAAR